MTDTPRWACGAVLAAVTACGGGPPAADFVLRGGHVIPVVPPGARAEALAIVADTIAFVGPDSLVAPWIGPETAVIELHGRAVLPGFHDAHVHPIKGGLELGGLELTDAGTIAEVLGRVARYAGDHPDLPWIRGRGWRLPLFTGANPHKALLDSLVPDRPVYLIAQDAHSAWVNSAALDAAGITAATPDPPNGSVERDAAGRPTGTLREAAMHLVAKRLPPPGPGDLRRALEGALARAAGFGITALHDANADASHVATYARLAREGALTAHVTAVIGLDPDTLGEASPPAPAGVPPSFRVTGYKLFLDGVLEAHTAALLAPYVDPPRDLGPTPVARERLFRLVTALDALGEQLHFHAIGDRAVRDALDAVAYADSANGMPVREGRPPLLAHVQLVHPDDLPRFATLGAVAVIQPLWAWPDEYITELSEPRIGPDRSRRLYPFGSLAAAGAPIAGGSDWPVTTMDPWRAIQVAVTRRRPEAGAGAAWLPGETLTPGAAIEAYTIGAARANGLDGRTGSLEVGKAADMVVVDRDPFGVPAHRLHEVTVVMTMFGGRVVYER